MTPLRPDSVYLPARERCSTQRVDPSASPRTRESQNFSGAHVAKVGASRPFRKSYCWKSLRGDPPGSVRELLVRGGSDRRIVGIPEIGVKAGSLPDLKRADLSRWLDDFAFSFPRPVSCDQPRQLCMGQPGSVRAYVHAAGPGVAGSD